jgi:hypothetical protein
MQDSGQIHNAAASAAKVTGAPELQRLGGDLIEQHPPSRRELSRK